jgi:RNA exonuclease 1
LQCSTVQGLELARISVVDENKEVIYDTYVVPENPILDHNTK